MDEACSRKWLSRGNQIPRILILREAQIHSSSFNAKRIIFLFLINSVIEYISLAKIHLNT